MGSHKTITSVIVLCVMSSMNSSKNNATLAAISSLLFTVVYSCTLDMVPALHDGETISDGTSINDVGRDGIPVRR